jgi:hypothetical protein
MRAGQLEMFPQKIGKIDPRRNQRFDALAVNLKRNGMRCRCAGSQGCGTPRAFSKD